VHREPKKHIRNLLAEYKRLIVLGDFGRASTYKFCSEFVAAEQKVIQKLIGENQFYDEYRKTIITVISNSPYIKKDKISEYFDQHKPLDDKILIGFPEGITIEEVIPKFSMLLARVLQNYSRKDVQDTIIALPCNTLSPLMWQLEQLFQSKNQLQRVLDKKDQSVHVRQFMKILPHINISFYSVAEAVIDHVQKMGFKFVLPLGTCKIFNIYKDAAERSQSEVEVIKMDAHLHELILKAIVYSVSDSKEILSLIIEEIRDELEKVYREYKDPAIIEACTDLSMGIGAQSSTIYANYLINIIYNTNNSK